MSHAKQLSGWTQFTEAKKADDLFVAIDLPTPRDRSRKSTHFYLLQTKGLKMPSSSSIFRERPGSKSRNFNPDEVKVADISTSKADQKMSEMDAKIAASEARTDTKFAEMMGELRLINSRMAHVENSVNEVKGFVSGLKQTIVTTAIVTAVGVIGVVVAIFGYGTTMFATGMDAQTIADKASLSAVQSISPEVEILKKGLEKQEQQYDLILKAIQSQSPSKAP